MILLYGEVVVVIVLLLDLRIRISIFNILGGYIRLCLFFFMICLIRRLSLSVKVDFLDNLLKLLRVRL